VIRLIDIALTEGRVPALPSMFVAASLRGDAQHDDLALASPPPKSSARIPSTPRSPGTSPENVRTASACFGMKIACPVIDLRRLLEVFRT